MTHEKVELEDIIGIVKTDTPTNSVELKKEIYTTENDLRHQPISNPKYDVGAFYVVAGYSGESCPVIINGNVATNSYIASLLNEWNDWLIELISFKENVFFALDTRITTLKKNSEYCHQSGSHEKGMEFTAQAELLERLKKALLQKEDEEED